MTLEHDYVWKVIVAGDGGVGKTTIIHRYIENEFLDMLKLTIGCEFRTQVIERSGKIVSLVLWDLGGQDRFRFFQDKYMCGASGCFLCFDMSRYATLDNCVEWVKMLNNNCPGVPTVLVGTKLDLVRDDNEYTSISSAALKMVDELGLLTCIFTSAKTGDNVNETIMYMVDTLLYEAYKHENGQ
jgi:small GTP-binding protein